MPRRAKPVPDHQTIELDGKRYVILAEQAFEMLCRQAGVKAKSAGLRLGKVDLDRDTLAEKLSKRRRVAGLTQKELAERAGIRAETLNRIERGRTTPDFRTIRKLVEAIDHAEATA